MSGWSPVKPVTEELKNICSQMKPQIEQMTGATFEVYIPLKYTVQVDGANSIFAVKVKVGASACVHAKIFKSGGVLNLDGTRYPKSQEDDLIPF